MATNETPVQVQISSIGELTYTLTECVLALNPVNQKCNQIYISIALAIMIGISLKEGRKQGKVEDRDVEEIVEIIRGNSPLTKV